MNHESAQNWNGYQEYPVSHNLRCNSQNEIFLLCLNRYLFSVVNGNRNLPRCSKENVLSITITENVTMSRYVVLVVFLDFVMIH